MNTNLEEAATIAAEFIASLENLPSETTHLLMEIQHIETRSHELQQEIHKDGGKYIRHSLRSAGATPPQALSAKDAAIPQTIANHYAEIDQLAVEKGQLADRLVRLVSRAQARLEHDVSNILVLQGDGDSALQGGYYVQSAARNPVQQMNESLRNALSAPQPVEAPATPAASSSAQPLKRRRVATTNSAGSIKLPSPAPMSAGVYGVGQRSRLSQQVHPRQSPLRSRRVTASAGPDADEDAEGEDDLEDAVDEGGEAEDKELYCFCQKLSYGEMIACDNPHCRYQWFHLPCVNLKPPLPDNWYCSECAPRNPKVLTSATGTGRKGRKK
ncbi:hypothetical protein B0H21DRAFT_689592 [Amylocystis lapponica]|nr:hypothetical protein B0H21DRAFT_689592 [Amylocystis lapponica]